VDSVFIAIIGVIAIIAVTDDRICLRVDPDDNLVEEHFEDPCDEPSGTRTHLQHLTFLLRMHLLHPVPSLRQHVIFIIST
jgi:hypothetical protein